MDKRPRIFMKDIRATHMCSYGGRLFFKKHNLDWTKFLQEGLPIEEVSNIDDEMLKAVIKTAEERIKLETKNV